MLEVHPTLGYGLRGPFLLLPVKQVSLKTRGHLKMGYQGEDKLSSGASSRLQQGYLESSRRQED